MWSPLRERDRRRPASSRLLGVSCAFIVLAHFFGCEARPSKSQYVSAVVRKQCPPEEAESVQALQACRLDVIRRFSDTSLEEMERLYPPPDPPVRPSCSLW